MTTIRETLLTRSLTLSRRAEALIHRSKQIAIHAPSSFPTATSHGREHLETVEKIADMLLPVKLIDEMQDHEIYFLLLAIYYHDLGMVGEEREFLTEEGRDKIRQQHATSVGTKIVTEWRALGFENENEANTLADICRGHRPDKDASGVANWNSFVRIKPIEPGESVRIRLVAALIYAIDELHLGDDRASERLRNWVKIENEESRKHWSRHSFISGPIAIAGGCIMFEANIKTFACEDDLRRNVFAKAFSALRDLNSQLKHEGLAARIPQPTIQWNRKDLIKLVLIKVAGDESCESEDDLRTEAIKLIRENRENCFALNDLCNETGNAAESIDRSISQTIEQFLQQGVLTKEPDSLKPIADTTQQTVEAIGNILRAADELDVLLKGKFSGNHEFDFHCSPFGKRFVTDQVLPEIKSRYGVDPERHPKDASIVSVLAASPSAARLAIELKPIHSELVKRRLLASVAIAGFSRDCLQNPQLILKKAIRHDFRIVAELVTKNYEKSVEFYEELALVGGFDMEKLYEIIQPSPEQQAEKSKVLTQGKELEEFTITLSQKAAPGQPTDTLFPYFLLAGERSGTHVELMCNYGSSIKLNHSKTPTDSCDKISEPACSFIAGPGQATAIASIDLRCSISFSPTSKKLSLLAADLSEAKCFDFPLILSLPRPTPSSQGKQELKVNVHRAKLTVSDALNLIRYYALCDVRSESEIGVSLYGTGQRLLTLTTDSECSRIKFESTPIKLIERLAEYDKTLPFPWFIEKEHETAILQADASSLNTVLSKIKSELRENSRVITSFVLTEENESGTPYREEWLGFLPGMDFVPPKLNPQSITTGHTVQEINERWNKREGEFKLESKFREDTAAIAESIRSWASSGGKDAWPITSDSSVPAFHHAKTIFSYIRRPIVDRFWYREAPEKIVVRPTNQIERLEVEKGYWAAVDDHDREELVAEKIARLLNLQKNSHKSNVPERQEKPPVAEVKTTLEAKKQRRRSLEKQLRRGKRS